MAGRTDGKDDDAMFYAQLAGVHLCYTELCRLALYIDRKYREM